MYDRILQSNSWLYFLLNPYICKQWTSCCSYLIVGQVWIFTFVRSIRPIQRVKWLSCCNSTRNKFWTWVIMDLESHSIDEIWLTIVALALTNWQLLRFSPWQNRKLLKNNSCLFWHTSGLTKKQETLGKFLDILILRWCYEETYKK